MKIVAIGGGEIGRPNKETGGFYPIQTESIDREIIRLTGKENPKLLLIPTASSDDPGYLKVVEKYFGEKLGCQTDVLCLLREKPSKAEIEKKIFGSDIVYVGGGPGTQMMIGLWKEKGLDKILREAGEKGIVLSGVSAGAICWFQYGNSDSNKLHDPKTTELITIDGLGFIPSMVCPHYNDPKETNRKPSLLEEVKKTGRMALALENCTALEVVDGECRIIYSSGTAKAYKVYRSFGRVIEKEIPRSEEFKPVDKFLKSKR